MAGAAVFAKTVLINRLRNQAVHGHRPVQQFDALTAVSRTLPCRLRLAHTYARGAKPPPGLTFDPDRLKPGLQTLGVPPSGGPTQPQTIEQLQRLETELRERDEKLSALLADKTALDAELILLRVEIAKAKKANTAQTDTHDYSEAETRDYFIDLLLKEAGWELIHEGHDTEYPVTGMPNQAGEGFVDYVLWGDDGLPLALNEAKRTKRDPGAGRSVSQSGRRFAATAFRVGGYSPTRLPSVGLPPLWPLAIQRWAGDGIIISHMKKNPVDLQALTTIQQNNSTPQPLLTCGPITLTVCASR